MNARRSIPAPRLIGLWVVCHVAGCDYFKTADDPDSTVYDAIGGAEVEAGPSDRSVDGSGDAGDAADGGAVDCQSIASSDETCDGIDDDCDGRVDEDFEVRPMDCGIGECKVSGLVRCVDGAESEACEPRRPHGLDVCDGKDEDCDGRLDEDWQPSRCGIEPGCANWTICARGEEICPGGEFSPPPNQPPSAEECNGIDDDCDGFVDEAPCNGCPIGTPPPHPDGWACADEARCGMGSGGPWVCVQATGRPWVLGSPPEEVGRFAEQEAQHEVWLTYDFYVQAHETTEALWHAIMQADEPPPNCPECPASEVTWYRAVVFANEASIAHGFDPCYVCAEADGRVIRDDQPECSAAGVRFDPQSCSGYRLPTEAEWEIAARAGLASPFAVQEVNLGVADLNQTCSHIEALDEWAVYCATADRERGALPPFDRRATRWGLVDVHGNLCEWTSGWMSAPANGRREDPHGPDDGELKVCRGGSWNSEPRRLRFAARTPIAVQAAARTIGLRLVRTIIRGP